MKFKICEKCKINFTENGEQYCRYCAPNTDEVSVETSKKNYRSIFFVFQGKQFEHECIGGYIYAPSDTSISHWNRMLNVKKGDIILHGSAQGILAISEAKGRCFKADRPVADIITFSDLEKNGWMVNLQYKLLENPISTAPYRSDIIRLQGDGTGKGYPFNKNGTGNQGYLFNMNKELFLLFIREILKRNPSLAELDYIQDILKTQKG